MTVSELLARFPEIPKDLGGEPVLKEFAQAFGGMIRLARKPAPCVRDPDAEHIFYLKLINDLAIYGLGLARRQKTVARLQDLVDQYRMNSATFGCSLVPHRPRGAARDLGCQA